MNTLKLPSEVMKHQPELRRKRYEDDRLAAKQRDQAIDKWIAETLIPFMNADDTEYPVNVTALLGDVPYWAGDLEWKLKRLLHQASMHDATHKYQYVCVDERIATMDFTRRLCRYEIQIVPK